AIRSHVGHDNSEIEMTMYVPINSADHDPNTQAIFKREEYYSIGGKIISTSYAKMKVSTLTHLSFLNKDFISNKCPLKVALAGTPQKMPTNSIIWILFLK
ncbi:16236_t:CDS:2, partial [Gigaspora margarita]